MPIDLDALDAQATAAPVDLDALDAKASPVDLDALDAQASAPVRRTTVAPTEDPGILGTLKALSGAVVDTVKDLTPAGGGGFMGAARRQQELAADPATAGSMGVVDSMMAVQPFVPVQAPVDTAPAANQGPVMASKFGTRIYKPIAEVVAGSRLGGSALTGQAIGAGFGGAAGKAIQILAEDGELEARDIPSIAVAGATTGATFGVGGALNRTAETMISQGVRPLFARGAQAVGDVAVSIPAGLAQTATDLDREGIAAEDPRRAEAMRDSALLNAALPLGSAILGGIATRGQGIPNETAPVRAPSVLERLRARGETPSAMEVAAERPIETGNPPPELPGEPVPTVTAETPARKPAGLLPAPDPADALVGPIRDVSNMSLPDQVKLLSIDQEAVLDRARMLELRGKNDDAMKLFARAQAMQERIDGARQGIGDADADLARKAGLLDAQEVDARPDAQRFPNAARALDGETQPVATGQIELPAVTGERLTDADIVSRRTGEPVSEPPDPGLARTEAAMAPEKRFISDELYNRAVARQEARFKDGRLFSGMDPGAIGDAVIYAAYHFENGVRNFAELTRMLVSKFGDAIQPHIAQVWEEAIGTKPPAPAGPGGGKAAGAGLISTDPEKRVGALNRRTFTGDEAEEIAGIVGPEMDSKRRMGTSRESITIEAAGNLFTREQARKWTHKDGASAVTAEALGNQTRGALAEFKANPDDPDALGALTDYATAYSGVVSELGRGLGQLNKEKMRWFDELSPRDKAVVKLAGLKGPDGTKASPEAIKKLMALREDDVVGAKDIVVGEARRTAGPLWWVHPYDYAGLLSSPVTATLNATSGVTNALVAFPGAMALQGRAGAYYRGAMGSIGEATKRFLFAFEHGYTQKSAFDLGDTRLQLPGKLKNPLNVLPNLNLAVDDFLKAVAYGGKSFADADTKARQMLKGSKLKGKELERAIAEKRAEYLMHEDVVEAADAFAREVTFQKELPAWMKMLQRGMEQAHLGHFNLKGGENVKPLKAVFPFIEIPFNFARTSLEFTPLGAIRFLAKDRASAADILGKAGFGTAMLTVGTAYMLDGQITGALPKDAQEREAFYRAGKRPNSVKIKDTWVPFASLGAMAGPLTIIASVGEAMEDARKRGDKAGFANIVLNAAIRFTAAFAKDQSFLSGFNTFFAALDDPDNKWDAFWAMQAGRMLPASSGLRFTASATDDTLRETNNMGDRFINSIPGLRQELPARLDNMGNPIAQPAPNLPGMNAGVSFGEWLAGKQDVEISRPDPIYAELDRLGIIPGRDNGTVETQAGVRYALSPDEARKILAGGSKAYPALQRVMNSPEYRALPDEYKKMRVEDAFSQYLQEPRRDIRDQIRRSYENGRGQGVRLR